MLTSNELTTLFSKSSTMADDFLAAYEELLAPANRDSATATVRGMLTDFRDHPEKLSDESSRAVLNHLLLLCGMLKDEGALSILKSLLLAPEFNANIPQNGWAISELSRILGELHPAGSLPEMAALALDPATTEPLTSTIVMAMVFRWFAEYERDTDFLAVMKQLCERMPQDKITFELGMTIIVNAIAVGGEQLRQQVYDFYNANSSKFQPQLPEKNLKNFFDLGRQRIKNMLRANYMGHYTTPQGELTRMLGYNPDAEEPQNTPKALPPIVRDHPKVGRNDPCPCGSGKKYKNCCGR